MNDYVFLADPTDPETVYIQKTTFPAITGRVVMVKDKLVFEDVKAKHQANSYHPCAVVEGYLIAVVAHEEIPTDKVGNEVDTSILHEMSIFFYNERICRRPKRYSANADKG